MPDGAGRTGGGKRFHKPGRFEHRPEKRIDDMKIIVAGTGYVGLVHAAVCAEFGHEVVAYDNDAAKIEAFASGRADRIAQYIDEPGLSDAIRKVHGRHLFFSTALADIVEGTDAVFLCLPTPPRMDGSTNLSFYDAAVSDIAAQLAGRSDKRRVVVVNKSTVPIGTARRLKTVLQEKGVANAGAASNPEFLAEGTAVPEARKPDRIVIGCDEAADFAILRRIYAKFVHHVQTKYIETTPETAEAIKYVANTMLLTYISFWNGVGAKLGEKFPGINIDDLRIGVTADDRISTWGSFVSNGAGGSCFGKDIASLIYQLKRANVDTKMLEASYEVNEYQKVYMVDRAVTEAGFNFSNKTVAVLGLAFKKNTNDMRDASSIKVIESLLGKGVASIRAYDPIANEAAARTFDSSRNVLFEKIGYFDSARAAMEGTDALFISSDCEEFRGLSRTIEETAKPPYLIMDGRRMIPDYNALLGQGFTYLAVGSALMRS